MLIRWILKLIRILNSRRGAGEVAGGIAFGLLLALIPAGGLNLLWLGIFLITFFLKVNFAAELLFLGLFKLIAPLSDPLLDWGGYQLLTLAGLQNLYTWLYNRPVVPFTRFYNTLVMGGLALGVLLWTPAFFLFRSLVVLYREKLKAKLEGSRLVKALNKLPLVSALIRAVGKAGGLSPEGS